MYQNYVRLSGGMSNEAMRLLTGMPVIMHLPKYYHRKYSDEMLWSILSKALAKDHIVVADVEKGQEGLELGNVYQVVSTYHGSLTNETTDKEIKLRDPYHSNYPTQQFNNWNYTSSSFTVTPAHFRKLFSTFSVTLYS